MCGIAGVLTRNTGGADRDLVEKLIGAIKHRGPDGQGTWLSNDSSVALAHARLSVIDLSSAAAQPMLDRSGEIALVFNGEIYNFVELRAELSALGRAFRTDSDTEVLLEAYLEWGQDCLSRLNGMFAFAIWDGRTKALFAARDRFGEKPFYYRTDGDRFIFGSEIKALLADDSFRTGADERAMVRFLALARLDGEESTFFRGIRQLLPGHWLTVDRSRVRIGRYWDLEPADELRSPDADCIDQFRALFLDSVRLRLRSDVPVGTGLSGGLDSSAVVGAIRRLRPSGALPQVTFSARHLDHPLDEGRFIQAVVGLGGVTDYHVFLQPTDALADLPRLMWHQEEPFVSLSQYAQYKVMELARQHGVTVLLDGQGADEQLAGYHPPSFGGRFASLVRRGQFVLLLKQMVAYARKQAGVKRAGRFLVSSLLPVRARLQLKATNEGALGILQPGLWNHYAESFAAEMRQPFKSPLRNSLFQQMTSSSLPSLLRFEDRNSMAFSREARLPFLDHRLVELAFRLSERLLVDDGLTKIVLRRAMGSDLPEVITNRRDKLGFATPDEDWIRGPLREWFVARLRRAMTMDLLRPAETWELWQRFQAKRGSLGPLWRAVNLLEWRERFCP